MAETSPGGTEERTRAPGSFVVGVLVAYVLLFVGIAVVRGMVDGLLSVVGITAVTALFVALLVGFNRLTGRSWRALVPRRDDQFTRPGVLFLAAHLFGTMISVGMPVSVGPDLPRLVLVGLVAAAAPVVVLAVLRWRSGR